MITVRQHIVMHTCLVSTRDEPVGDGSVRPRSHPAKSGPSVVALFSEAQGSTISCGDVVPFVRDELRLPSGSIYDIRTIPDVDEAEMSSVGASLKSAGYRFIGGTHVMFITGPQKDR
jgi:hypothetical protein